MAAPLPACRSNLLESSYCLPPLPSCRCFAWWPSGYLRSTFSKRLEHATRNFSTKELRRHKPGGLYSTIGRSTVGLIETDIDDLTATATSRTEVLASTRREAVAKSLAGHNHGVLVGLLGHKPTATLPTVNPDCFHDPLGSRTDTPGSPKRPRSTNHTTGRRNKRGTSSGGGAVAPAAPPVAEANPAPPPAIPDEGLERSERQRVIGADEDQHREDLADNLRRLRALLDESETAGDARQAGGPSLFSVREMRAIGAAKRQRQLQNTCGAREGGVAGDQDTREADIDKARSQQPTASEATAQQGGAAAELAVGGNALLRNLAKALFSSMQSRIQNEFLLLGFRQWKVMRCCFGVALRATCKVACLPEAR